MNTLELKEKLDSLSHDEFNEFFRKVGRIGDHSKNETIDAFIEFVAEHPEHERKICKLLGLQTEDQKKIAIEKERNPFIAKGCWYMVPCLFPIIPFFSLYPFLFIALKLSKIFKNFQIPCETAIKICLFILLLILLLIIVLEVFKAVKAKHTDIKHLKTRFRLLCIYLTLLLNPILMIVFLGVDEVCHGSGLGMLMIIYTAPLAAFSFPIFGLFYDKMYIHPNANNRKNQ